MTDPQIAAQFKQRLIAVVKDLRENGSRDAEALGFIGSLAADLAKKTGQTSWSGLKAQVTRAQYDEMLGAFQRQGNKLIKDGKTKQAYAIQTLATSLIAMTQRKDPEVAEGEKLLDIAIDRVTSLALGTGRIRKR